MRSSRKISTRSDSGEFCILGPSLWSQHLSPLVAVRGTYMEKAWDGVCEM